MTDPYTPNMPRTQATICGAPKAIAIPRIAPRHHPQDMRFAIAMAPRTMTRMIAIGVNHARMLVCRAVAPVMKGDACANASAGEPRLAVTSSVCSHGAAPLLRFGCRTSLTPWQRFACETVADQAEAGIGRIALGDELGVARQVANGGQRETVHLRCSSKAVLGRCGFIGRHSSVAARKWNRVWLRVCPEMHAARGLGNP